MANDSELDYVAAIDDSRIVILHSFERYDKVLFLEV